MKAEAGGAWWALSVTGGNDSTATATASGISCKIRDKWTKSRQMRECVHVYMHLDTHIYTHTRVVRASPLPAAIKLLAVS